MALPSTLPPVSGHRRWSLGLRRCWILSLVKRGKGRSLWCWGRMALASSLRSRPSWTTSCRRACRVPSHSTTRSWRGGFSRWSPLTSCRTITCTPCSSWKRPWCSPWSFDYCSRYLPRRRRAKYKHSSTNSTFSPLPRPSSIMRSNAMSPTESVAMCRSESTSSMTERQDQMHPRCMSHKTQPVWKEIRHAETAQNLPWRENMKSSKRREKLKPATTRGP